MITAHIGFCLSFSNYHQQTQLSHWSSWRWNMPTFGGSCWHELSGTGGTGRVAAAGTGTGQELSAGTGAAGPDSAAPVSCDIAAVGSSVRSTLTPDPTYLPQGPSVSWTSHSSLPPSPNLTLPSLIGRSLLKLVSKSCIQAAHRVACRPRPSLKSAGKIWIAKM